MNLELKNKIIIVTGAAGIKGSIGETIIKHLVKEGSIPAIIDRNDRGFEYVEEIKKSGIDALFCKTDVTDPNQIKKSIKLIAAKYGRIKTNSIIYTHVINNSIDSSIFSSN